MSAPSFPSEPVRSTVVPEHTKTCSADEWHRDKAIISAHSHNLMIALRTNPAFSSRQRLVEVGKEGSHKIMSNVKALRKDLLTAQTPLSHTAILKPFIEVSKSEETNGKITGVSLSALSTFLELRLSFIDIGCIVSIAGAALEVRSELTDAQLHEAVLGRILHVLKACVCHPLGVHLPETVVLRMLQQCFAIALHGAPSEVLTNIADSTTNDMITHLYQSVASGAAPHCFSGVFAFLVKMISVEVDTVGTLLGKDTKRDAEDTDGMACKKQLAATKYSGLTLVCTILATLRGHVLEPACAPLLAIIQDELCRALLTCSASVDNVYLVAQLLRTLQLTALTCGDHIAPQLLSFLLGTYLRDDQLHDPEAAERKEVVLESLLEFCSVESFPAFLVRAYDFDINSPHVFEVLCKHLVAQCHPSPPNAESGPMATPEQLQVTQMKAEVNKFATLFNVKPKKAIQHLRSLPVDAGGRNVFGMAPDGNGTEVGKVLYRYRDVLDKVMLGEYVSEGGLDPAFERHAREGESKDDFEARLAATAETEEGRECYHLLIRNGYYDQFNFEGMTLIGAMRQVLGTYRLPGEAQRIDRLMEMFTSKWFAQTKGSGDASINPFADADAAFVFAFSVIMLNTDLHSTSVEHKMTLKQFTSNNRGTNAGGDVAVAYQEATYNDIKGCEIKLKDTVTDIASEDYCWMQAVERSRAVGGTVGPIAAAAARDYDWYLFTVLVDPAIAALSAVTEAVDEDTRDDMSLRTEKQVVGGEIIINDALQGLYLCGAMAAHFGMTTIIDKLVIALCKFTDMFQPKFGSLAVTNLGRSAKGLSAIKALFKVVHDHGAFMGLDAWVEAMDLLLRIYMLGCLPEQQQLSLPVIEKPESPQKTINFTPVSVAHSTASVASNISQRGSSVDLSPQTGSYYDSPNSPIMCVKPLGKASSGDEEKPASSWFFGTSDEVKRQQAAQTRAALSRVCRVIGECNVTSIIGDRAADLPAETLTLIVKALIKTSGVQMPPPGSDPNLAVAHPSLVHATIFSVHLLADLLVSNGNRYHVASAKIEGFFARLLLTAERYSQPQDAGSRQAKQEIAYWMAVGEHVVLSKMRIFVRVSTAPDRSAARTREVLKGLITLDKLPAQIFGTLVARHLAAALNLVLRSDALQDIKEAEVWEMLITLANKSGLLAKDPPSTLTCFELLKHLGSRSTFAWPDNVPSLVQALTHLYLFLSTTTEDADWEHVARPAAPPALSEGAPQPPADPSHPPPLQPPAATAAFSIRVVGCLTSIRETLVACAPSLQKPSPRYITAWLSLLNGYSCIVASATTTRAAQSADSAFLKECSDALEALKRSLLAPETASLPIPVLCDAFRKILVPLVSNLCQGSQERALEGSSGLFGRFSVSGAISTVFGGSQPDSPLPAEQKRRADGQRQLTGVEDLQTRVLGLLCRSFLHFTENAGLAAAPAEFMGLWNRLLGILYAYHSRPPSQAGGARADASEAVREEVSEQLRIMINVLAEKDLHTIPQFWIETRQLIAPFKDLAPSLNEHLNILGLPGAPASPQPPQ